MLQVVIGLLAAVRGDGAVVEVYDKQNHAGKGKTHDSWGFIAFLLTYTAAFVGITIWLVNMLAKRGWIGPSITQPPPPPPRRDRPRRSIATQSQITYSYMTNPL